MRIFSSVSIFTCEQTRLFTSSFHLSCRTLGKRSAIIQRTNGPNLVTILIRLPCILIERSRGHVAFSLIELYIENEIENKSNQMIQFAFHWITIGYYIGIMYYIVLIIKQVCLLLDVNKYTPTHIYLYIKFYCV